MENLSTHGNTFVGRVVSAKMHKTVVVEWDRRSFIPKLERYEKARSKVSAHVPKEFENEIKEDDIVEIKGTRPISKTKNFVVTKIIKAKGEQNESN